MEVIWDIFASIMDNRLCSSITLHYALDGFIQGIWMGKSTLEAKKDRQLAGIFHDPLFQVFLFSRKTYDSLDRVSYMEILRVYGLGPNP